MKKRKAGQKQKSSRRVFPTAVAGTMAVVMAASAFMPVSFAAGREKTEDASQPESLAPVIFEEDFEDDALSVEFGTYSGAPAEGKLAEDPTNPEEQSYKVTSPNGYLYVMSDDWAEWQNYTFEFRLYIDTWTDPGSQWDNVAPFVLGEGTGVSNPSRSAFKYKRDGNFAFFTSVGDDQQVKSAGGSFEQKWHDYRIETAGSNVKLYVDDELIYDVSGPRSSGTVGFDGLSSVYYIDDLKLTRQTAGKVESDHVSGTYETAFDAVLTAGEGESIYYTLDGSDPTENGILYTGPVRIAGDCTLKAAAYAEGKCYGEVASYEYKVTEVAAPVIEPVSGRYKDSVEVTMTCDTPDAVIRYTLDGSEPTEESTAYTEPLTITESVILKAKAFREGYPASAAAEREYIITDDLVERRIYVEVDGDDETGDGTEEHPFATVERAREEVDKYNDNMMGDIEVLIGEGQYYVDEAVAFDENDSGSNGRQVIYKSADGVGKAEFIGGRQITGWEPTTEADTVSGLDGDLVGKVYKVTLDPEEYNEFNALYVEGVDSGYGNDKAIMARTPNYEHDPDFPVQRGSYYRTADGTHSSITWKDGDLTEEEIAGMVYAWEQGWEVAQFYAWEANSSDWDWFTSTLPVHTIDVGSRTLTAVSDPDQYYPHRSKFWIGWNARYFIQGNLAFLDVPGEYHYNKTTGELYYYPAEGVDMDSVNVVAPQTKEIFRFEGSDKAEIETWADEPDPEKQASNITLDGLSMKYTEFTNSYSYSWNYSEGGVGYHAPESYGSTQPSYDEQSERREFKVGAVTMINTNHITVQNCSIHNVGHWGVALYRDNQYNIVQNCDIGYTGNGGLMTDGGYPGVGKYNNHNTFYNLRVHDAGQNMGHAGSVSIWSTGQSLFSHLDIHNSPRRTLTMLGGYSRDNTDAAFNPLTDVYSVGNTFEYINCYGGEQDSGEDSSIFFAMMISNSYGHLPEELQNHMNQVVIDRTGAAPSMHDKNTAHGMEFAMGVAGMDVSNVMGINSQSNTLAIYYEESNGAWDVENTNNNYYDEDIINGFDRSKMELDEIGTTDDFPFAPEWEESYAEPVPEDLYFGDDFETGKISLRKWTVENGQPRINAANVAEGPYDGMYSMELKGGSASAPAVLSRSFENDLNKIVEVKFFDKRQDYAGSDKYGGRPNTNVRADDGETVVAIGANGYENSERYYYIYGDEKVWTDVQRSFGWHTFRFDYTSGTDVKLYIDDELIATLPETSFNYVAMSDWSGNERQACYDQFWIYGGEYAPPCGDAGEIEPPAEAEKDIFQEDFEGENVTEFVKGGNKYIESEVTADPDNGENKVLKVEARDGVLYFNDAQSGCESWANYVYEIRMKLESWGGTPWDYFGPTFYVAPGDSAQMDRYAIKYDKATNCFILYRGSGNANLTSGPVPEGFDPTQWHTYKIDVENGTIRLYLDGGEEPVFTVDNASIRAGTVGLEGLGANFYVDDLKVERKDTAAPEADHESGTYSEPISVSLSVSDAAAQIFYTLDGSDPRTEGLYYYGDAPVVIDHSCTLKIVAVGQGKCYSPVVEIPYTIENGEEPEEPADKTLLQKTYDYGLQQSTDGVADSAKEFFEKVMAEAKAVLDDPDAAQEEVNAAWNNLLEGIWGLGLVKGDTTMLKMLIDRAEAMVAEADRYVQDNWQQLTDALAAAKEVAADGDALQEDVEEASDALLNAILAQRYKANKDNLQSLVDSLADIDLSKYTEESVQVFKTAMAQANAILADATLSTDDQAKVDAAAEELAAARDGLVAKTDDTGDGSGDGTGDGGSTGEGTTGDGSTGDGTTGNNGSGNSGTSGNGSSDGNSVDKAAKTGDNANIALIVAVMIAAVAVGGAVVVRKKRNF